MTFIEFTVPISLELNGTQLIQANRWINTHYTGKPEVSQDTKVKYSKEHVDASYGANRSVRTKVKVKMDETGRLRLA